jgi:hypothetical protein
LSVSGVKLIPYTIGWSPIYQQYALSCITAIYKGRF